MRIDDAHGQVPSYERARYRWRRSCRACTAVGAPLEARARQDVSWPCNTDQVHRPFPRDPRDLELSARATAATRCWARSASRCGSRRSWAATGQGWLAEHMLILKRRPRRRAREIPLCRRRLPVACGKTNFAMLIPPDRLRRLEDHDHRRRHLPGSSPAPTAACMRSIPRPATSASRRVPTLSPTPTAWRACSENVHLHQRRADRRRRRLVGRHDRGSRRPTLIDWQGKDWTPAIAKEDRRQGCPPERPLHGCRDPEPGASIRRRGTILQGVPIERDSSSAAAARPPCRW